MTKKKTGKEVVKKHKKKTENEVVKNHKKKTENEVVKNHKKKTENEVVKNHKKNSTSNHQQVHSSIQVEAENTHSLDPTQMYLKEIAVSSLLTAEEEVYYGRLVKKGDEAARKKMIESNLRLVVKIARHYYNRGIGIF